MRRRGAHKDGLSCNRGSTQDITGSRIRHDGSKTASRCCGVLKSCTRSWRNGEATQKRCLLGQRTVLNAISCADKGRSTAVAVAPVGRSLKALGAPVKSERVSLIYRNDDGVNARTLSRVQRTG